MAPNAKRWVVIEPQVGELSTSIKDAFEMLIKIFHRIGYSSRTVRGYCNGDHPARKGGISIRNSHHLANGPAAYQGTIVNRSNSNGTGKGVSVKSGSKAKSNPQFNTGFEGLNHYQQRYARGGNQFSVEPPDQGLCVGNGYVVEAVNDVF